MAPSARLDWSPLLHSLQQAAQLTHQLLDMLAREHDHLVQRDYAAFEQLLAGKTKVLRDLQSNTEQRHAWLQAQGMADDTAALARAEREAPELAHTWHQLADHWRQCQHNSQVNDQVAQRTRTVVGHLLDVLSGNAGQGSTYDGKGSTQRVQSARTITSA